MVAKGEPCAYAKLSGKLGGEPFNCYMMELPTTLGRASAATEGDKKPAGFIDLGKSKALSREHGGFSAVHVERVNPITIFVILRTDSCSTIIFYSCFPDVLEALLYCCLLC